VELIRRDPDQRRQAPMDKSGEVAVRHARRLELG
jgi:hypothetical protein